MDTKIIRKDPLALVDAGKLVSGLGKKAELPTIQQKVQTFAKKFSKITSANAAKLSEDLKKLEIPMFTEESISQICNILPQDLAELKSIFAGSKISISPENFKKILDVVIKYSKK